MTCSCCVFFLLLCVCFFVCFFLLGMVREKRGGRGDRGEDAWSVKYKSILLHCSQRTKSCCKCLCANYTHHKTLYMQFGLFTPTKSMDNYTQGTQHSSLHSLPDKTTHAYVPCSTATKIHIQHAIQTQHCSWTPQLLHTRQTISAMLSSD